MKDGAGVVGHGLNIAGDFIPNEYGKGIIYRYINAFALIHRQQR